MGGDRRIVSHEPQAGLGGRIPAYTGMRPANPRQTRRITSWYALGFAQCAIGMPQVLCDILALFDGGLVITRCCG